MGETTSIKDCQPSVRFDRIMTGDGTFITSGEKIKEHCVGQRHCTNNLYCLDLKNLLEKGKIEEAKSQLFALLHPEFDLNG